MDCERSNAEKDEVTDLLKDLDVNIDLDVAFLAGQTPPVKIFPTPNTSHLPYVEQLSTLEDDYFKCYSYRGDLSYNENMARSVGKKEGSESGSEDDTSMFRVCRDKSRFFETRVKDDVMILGKILEGMIQRTNEMEKHLENVLLESGETSLPNWDELFEEVTGASGSAEENSAAEAASMDSQSTDSRGSTPVNGHFNAFDILFRSYRLNQPNQMLTHEMAHMLVAQMMFEGSFFYNNHVYLNSGSTSSISSHSTESDQSPMEE